MVLFKIALVGAALAAALFLLKQQQVFQRAGIIGSCAVIAPPAGESSNNGQWWSCREGGLTGYPSLMRDSCDSRYFRSGREVWYCPAPLERAPGY